MASTIAIAASFQISPETLESWATGNKPTDSEEVKLYQEIFSQFEYVDGDWKPKTEIKTVAKTKKKATKKKATQNLPTILKETNSHWFGFS